MRVIKDITGQRFGRLVALRPTKKQDKLFNVIWVAKCDCGKIVEANGTTLRAGRKRSCGCLLAKQQVLNGKHNKTHGHSVNFQQSRTYRSWSMMIQRCGNPNRDHYAYYGGRGIMVCKRWLVFTNFLEDMGERPDGTSIDRINPNGNYEPANCRWATRHQQRINIRKRI